MLYLWGNCWSLSLCSPNLFYILLWPLVLSRPLRQLLLKKRKRQVHIDQDLHVYCQDCDLFYCVFLFGLSCFSVSCQKHQETWCKYFHSPYILGYTVFSCCKFMNVLSKEKWVMVYTNWVICTFTLCFIMSSLQLLFQRRNPWSKCKQDGQLTKNVNTRFYPARQHLNLGL